MKEHSIENQKARHMWWVGWYYFLQYMGWVSIVPAIYQHMLLPELLSPPADYALGFLSLATIVFAKKRAQHTLQKIDTLNQRKQENRLQAIAPTPPTLDAFPSIPERAESPPVPAPPGYDALSTR